MTPEQMRAEAARVARDCATLSNDAMNAESRCCRLTEYAGRAAMAEELAEAILAIPIPAPPADVDDLVSRLRALVIVDEVRSDNQLGKEAADTIERLAARVAELEAELKSEKALWPK